MNFVGKFDAKLQVDGSGAHLDAHHHVDSISAHAPAGAIIVPDADLLFNGDFKRSGVDLILSRNDHEWVVEDYFKGEKRVALASPDGAHLTGDIINAMAGHVEYAQADGSAGAGKVIGHVTKLVGTATAIRNGVSIILNQGDNVEKGDVVQSGSASTLGVTFIDGTVFGLSSNARMVLNEMVYDPKGSDNSTLFSLVSGTISFVAGQTAKHGDMKIDTPVATMGIRGTAVLVEIDFDVPGQNGKPEARFQVVMEPDGTIGSYILYDKNTFAPMALVDKAGQQVHISENNVSFSDSPLSPELQKLITDVFTLKFTTNPQTFTHFADTLIPQSFPLAPLPNGAVPTATIHLVTLSTLLNATPSAPAGPSPIPHINQPPVVTTVDSSVIERASLSGSSAIDSTSGTISFGDINLGDRPTAKATISSFTYQNAQHQDIAASVQELADIHALEDIPLVVVQAPGNTYFGTATWTLNVPDKAFDFLGAGDTLTLTYKAEVDSNYSGGSIPGFANFTITITGTNDVPVITTGPEKVAFVNVGTGTTGPNLPPTGPTINKFTFKDPDLTDTHTVSAGLTNATLSGNGVPTLDMQALEAKFPRPMGVFEHALSTAVTTDSFGTGTGTITWTLADISAYYADIVPAGETLKLTYTVTVKDSQGATSSQKVIVTITGSAPPAVVWVETTKDALTDPAPGDWNGAHNWETGTVPTASDDVIIITNQLQGQTPFYPVTIKAGGAAAFAHSVTMNDYGTLFTNSPTLINQNTLTVGAGGISLSADAILENFGTLSVGGLAEILQQASLQNSGTIKLLAGGDFKDKSSITNSDKIEISGGTLDVEVAVANAGGTIQVDSGATLQLNGASIDGGTVTGSGKIDVTGNSKIDSGATLNNGAATVESGVTLTLDGMTVNATTITDKGTIVLDGTVKLTGGATIEGVSASALGTITNDGTLEVAGAAELLNDTLTNTGGMIQVDDSQTLTLSGTEIIGGIINDFSGPLGGKIDVTGDSKIDSGATLNDGAVTVESGVTLTLDGMTVNATTITDKGTIVLDGTVKLTGGATIEGVSASALGTITNNGTLEVAGAAELLNDTLTNTSGIIQVDDSQTLTLNGTEIIGGIVNDFSGPLGGKIDVTGDSKIDSGATLNGGAVTVESGVTLTLDGMTVNAATITDKGTIVLDGTVKLTGGATIEGVSGSALGSITNDGTLEVAGAAELLNDTLTNTSGIIQVDDSQTLTLNGTEIIGGIINDFSGPLGGKIDVTGDSKIDSGATLNNGAAMVESGVTLTLDGMTVNAATITDKGTIVLDGTVKLTGGATIEGVSGSALGSITNDGTLEVAGAAELLNDTLTNTSGIIQVDDSQTLTLNGTEIIGGIINDFSGLLGGKIDVTGDSKIAGTGTAAEASLNGAGAGSTVQLDAALTLDYVKLNDVTLENGPLTIKDTVEVAGAVTLLNDIVTNTGATLQVDDGITLKLNGTTINGGTINDFSGLVGGTIDVTGASKIAGTGTAAEANLNGAGAGSTVQLDAALTLDYVKLNDITLENGPLTIKDTVEVAGAVTLLNDIVTNTGATLQIDDGITLKLNGTTINGGTINDFSGLVGGTIDVTGNSKIDSGATLNDGAVTVESGVTLTLDNMTVNGTVFNDLVTGGTVQIDGGDTLTFNGSTIDGGTLNIVGELDSTGTSFITGATIINSSHIDVVSGILTIDPTPVTNTGMIEVKGDATLVLSDEIITNTDGTTKGVIQVDADPTHTATLDLEGSTINGGTVTIAGVLDSTGDSFITGADITNTGTIDVTSGTLTIDATSILNNTGTLETNGGNLIIDTAFAGNLEIKGAAALELGSANAYSQVTVTFEPEATGTLKLDHSKTFSGTVAGLDDNTIDLVDIAYGSNPTVSYAGNVSGGILSVFAGGVDVSNIHLTGDYLGVHWTLTGDGSSQHGTDVMEVPGAVAGLDPNGNATQGVALTASITDGGQTVSGATYDWQVSHDGGKTWVDANGTNGLSSYTPVEADEGQLLRVALSFVDHSGEPEKSFVSAGVVQESLTDDLVATLDSQTAKQGVTMHVLGVTDGGITVTTGLTYAWQDSSDNGLTWVTVGAQPSYTPGESDEGKLMQLVVTYADASGSESSTYSLGMPNDLSATLDSTTAQQGLAIHVTGVKDGGGNVSSGVSYAWQVSSDDGQHWTTVGTHSSFTPIAADAGETLQVIVTYVDSEENESATYSLGTVAPANEWLGGNHNWQTAGQWATSGVPVSSDNTVIDASGFYTVKIDQAAVAHSLVVNDLGAAVEILAGNTLTLGGNATIEAGILQIDSGATLKDIAASATITGAFIDNGTVEAAGGTLEVASAISFGAGKFKIDAGATLQLDHADTLKVAFSGAGELILKDPTHFTGIISDGGGSLTSADVVDVAGFDTGASVSYSGFKSGGVVTITETGHTAVNLIVGANSTHWSAPVTDGHGGILIHDPPADTSGQDLGSVVMHDPAPAASGTIIASGPNQILTGNAASDTFAFNFTGVGHTTVTDFHPATDTLQFSSQLFADLEAALNATHDDGHGNTVVALDGHDTITLNGILKAQLHASDFHFV